MISEFAIALAERQKRVEIPKPMAKEGSQEAPFTRLRASTTDLSVLTDELKSLHQSPDEYWYAMGSRLQKILNQRLYRTGGYPSFSAFCTRGLGYSRQHMYKLIKVAHFIDELWMRAETPEQRKSVQRLFSLGFTKLYILNSLRPETLEGLLENGITVPGKDGNSSYTTTLEGVTIEQLKRSLSQETDRPSSTPIRPAKMRTLVTLLEVQTRALTRYIEQCRRDTVGCDEPDHLQTMEQYALSIMEGVQALSGRAERETEPTNGEPRLDC